MMELGLQPAYPVAMLLGSQGDCTRFGEGLRTPDLPVTPVPPMDDDAMEEDSAPVAIAEVATFMAPSQSTSQPEIFTSSSACGNCSVGCAWSAGGRDEMEDEHTVNLCVEAGCHNTGEAGSPNKREGRGAGTLLRGQSLPTPSTVAHVLEPQNVPDAAAGDGTDGPPSVGLIACFDGHGGPEVARFCARNIAPVLCMASAFDVGRGDLGAALTEAFLILDEAVIRHASDSGSGCCATVALLRGNQLTVAGVGDARAVLCRNGTAKALTTAHKPTDPAERDRIAGAGGDVVRGRINACLNVSRALGDAPFKQTAGLSTTQQAVSPEPTVTKAVLSPEDAFLVLACDGVWNAMGDQEVIDFVGNSMARGATPTEAARALVRFCMAPLVTAYDNLTVVITVFNHSSMATSHNAAK